VTKVEKVKVEVPPVDYEDLKHRVYDLECEL